MMLIPGLRKAFFALVIILFAPAVFSNDKVALAVAMQAGQATPQNDLTALIDPGAAYRIKLFGGAKLQLTAVKAVGLGLDFTYSQHEIKDTGAGHYERYLWDMFFLPIGVGPIRIIPGIAWVVTDTQIPTLGIDDVSIRPAGVLALETGINLGKSFSLTLMARAEKMINDFEPVTGGGSENIAGEFVTVLGGIEWRL